MAQTLPVYALSKAWGACDCVMTITLGSNISSLRGQRQLSRTSEELGTVFQRLSSGQRINKASDDAAGLAIADNLKADSRVYTQAIRNVSDGLSVLSIAQGALEELTAISIRQRELAEQAANGIYSLRQRQSMSTEANALVNEFNRIIESVEFNGTKLIDKSLDGLRIQAGYGLDGSIAFGIGDDLARTVGDATFDTGSIYSTHPYGATYAITMGDVNGDGKLDIVTAGYRGYGGGEVSVMLGNGTGGFSGPANYLMETTTSRDIALGDLNGDNVLDIVSAGTGSGGRATVRLGQGNGTFGAATSYLMEASSSSAVALGDLNGDNVLDIVTAGIGAGGRATVRLGLGNGTFGAATSYLTQGFSDIALGDLNSDGLLDLVAGGTTRLGQGDGTFGASISYAANASAIALGDLNLDGLLDVVSSNGGDVVRVGIGRGDGTFDSPATYTMEYPNAWAVTLGDLNGDGLLDVITAGYNYSTNLAGSITFRLGRSDGTFGAAVSYGVLEEGASGVVVGDVNGDGIFDIGVSGYGDYYGYGDFGQTSVLFGNSKEVTTSPFLNITTRQGALDAMTVIDATLNGIARELGAIGANQSRLDVALQTLAVSRENFDAAGSRIIDADIAEESSRLVRLNILQQAASSVLAQANQQPALALQLLRG